MPSISNRVEKTPASAIRKLAPYAIAAKNKGIEVIHLNIGQPDIKTPSAMLEEFKSFDHDVLSYTESAGLLQYRQSLCEYYAAHQVHIGVDDIIVTNGGSEALQFALLSCLDAGDEIIIPEPFYANYSGFASIGNINVVPISSSFEADFALPSISDFEQKITSKTKAILLCNPNNPTGYVYTRDELEKIAKLVIKHDLFIIVDEVYREFIYDSGEHVSILSLEGIEDNAILIDSISKRYSACGARIGCLISKNRDFITNAMKFAQARLCPPNLEQIFASASVRVPEAYFTEVIEEYVQRRNYITHALNDLDGVKCSVPNGAFYCIVELPVEDTDDFCKWLLTDFVLENRTVMLAPGSGFYINTEKGKKQVRIAYVLEIEKLRYAVSCIKEALLEYQRLKS